ncbi:MAG TPA: hypothetical protein VEU72_07630 [Nitrosopumilaceae archaeon]|nr:hypothetical protein [Nitrosopumilaceae archaeon]
MTLNNSSITFASILAVALFASPMLVFAQTTPIQNSEQISVKLDKNIYQYGDTIHLTIHDVNAGPKQVITAFKNNYAGINGPCGVQYFDFAFLSGDQTKIQNYDDLVAVKTNALNVIYANPYDMVLCPRGYTDHLDKMSVNNNSDDVTITTIKSNGDSVTLQDNLISKYEISKVYGNTLYKQIDQNTTLEYKESKTLPAGKYTVIAFTLSGQISKPTLIEIVNSSTSATSFTPSDSKGLQTVFSSGTNLWLASLFTAPALFGGFMALGRKTGKKFSNFATAIVMTIIVSSAFATSEQNNAFATYNVSSQGVEEHSTTSTFKTPSVQVGFEGVVTGTGTGSGLSVQNNHFIHGFSVGTGYLWAQSIVQQEIPTSATYNSHSCTTQAGSYTCKLPSSVTIRGLDNYWTNKDIFGGCPSGWTLLSPDCYFVPTPGNWNTVTLSSSSTRIDEYTYQNIDSSGNLNLIQKYRTCTSSCTGYTQLDSDTRAYATSSSYYDLTTYFGGTTYGVEAVVGECGTCGGGTGKVTFSDGTYGTETYTLDSSGSPAYRASGATTYPAENNVDLCWWSSIGNTGGSNPTLTATAKYGTCSS